MTVFFLGALYLAAHIAADVLTRAHPPVQRWAERAAILGLCAMLVILSVSFDRTGALLLVLACVSGLSSLAVSEAIRARL